MKQIDLYTRSILTVIAICLVILTLKSIDIIPSVYANKGTIENGDIKANFDGSINVKVINSSYDGIPVEVKNSSYNRIPVEVKN